MFGGDANLFLDIVRALKKETRMSVQKDSPITINKGTCYAMFAYDIGSSINLEQADRHISAETERSRLRHKAELHSISNIALRRFD